MTTARLPGRIAVLPPDSSSVPAYTGLSHADREASISENWHHRRSHGRARPRGLALGHLGSLGCDMAQGYFISRPASYEAFVSWLANTKTCARHCEDPSRVQLSHPFRSEERRGGKEWRYRG